MGFHSTSKGLLNLMFTVFIVVPLIAFTPVSASGQSFVDGDVNADLVVNEDDFYYLFNYVFSGGSLPIPPEAGNIDGCGDADLSDILFLGNHVINGAPLPEAGSTGCEYGTDQDPGIKDTCRYEPRNSTWVINTPVDSLFTVELWAWADEDSLWGATLGFVLSTSTGGGFGHDDSLIIVDSFLFDPLPAVDIFAYARATLDTNIQSLQHEYNGYLIGLIAIAEEIFPVSTPTRIGQLILASRTRWIPSIFS